MAGKRHGLSDAAVKAEKKTPGRYPDGESLYFQVTGRGNRSWEYNFRIHGGARSMGLGAYPKVSLKEARELRDEARRLVRTGIDPIVARGAKRQIAASALSVQHACESYIEAQKAKWKTVLHVDQIKQRLRDYVYPVIGHLPIADIKLAEAKWVLVPIWTRKNPTASRVRQYMEDVTDWAIHEGIRVDESNPWEVKRLRFALPIDIHRVTNHPSLPFEQAPAFLAELRTQSGVKARALEFVMLTAVRIADICGGNKAHSEPMKWSHVDLDAAMWRVPDTKSSRPHVVPLSEPALRLLGEMKRFSDPSNPDIVFPGANAGTVLSASTLRHMLKAMGHGGEVTTHGMRACFKTWALETATGFEEKIVDSCLAHAQEALDAAYHRGSFLARRRQLMSLWAAYLDGEAVQTSGAVVALRA